MSHSFVSHCPLFPPPFHFNPFSLFSRISLTFFSPQSVYFHPFFSPFLLRLHFQFRSIFLPPPSNFLFPPPFTALMMMVRSSSSSFSLPSYFLSLLPLLLLLFSQCSQISFACQCQWAPPKDNYCSSDWVAHVQVIKRQDGVRMPAGITDRQTDLNSRHEVKYLRMFKISKQMPVNQQNQVILPVNVYTATEDAACGILLESGHQYLLAGDYVNGTMLTGLCRQILLEDLKESRKHDILEWTEVPQKLKEQLEKQEFDQKCN